MTHNESQKSLAHQFWSAQDWTLSNDEIAMMTGKHKRTVRKWRSKLGHASLATNLYSAPFLPQSNPTSLPPSPSFEPSPVTQRSVREPEPPVTPHRSATAWVVNEVSDTIPAPSGGYDHRILFIPDAHIPYHDPIAWRTLLAVARVWKPTTIVILGDFLDLLCVSFHPKKPLARMDLDSEVLSGRDRLDELDALGAHHKFYIGGNHENRLKRYIASHAPMFGKMLNVPDLLGLERRGWEWTPYGEGRQLGEYFVTHDLNIAGKYAVRRSMDAAWSSTIIGHTHRLEIVHQTDARGRPCTGASFGCLIDFDAIDYQKKKITTRQWRHGLGLCHMDESGRGDLQAIPIHNGRCRVEGNVVTADDLQWSRAS